MENLWTDPSAYGSLTDLAHSQRVFKTGEILETGTTNLLSDENFFSLMEAAGVARGLSTYANTLCLPLHCSYSQCDG